MSGLHWGRNGLSNEMTELYLGPIIGGLSSTRAHLWGRAHGTGVLHAWLGHEPDLSDARLVSTSLPLTKATGFAGVAPLQYLAPNTQYYYALTLTDALPDQSGEPYPSFTTFPLVGQRQSFAFAFGSCFRPRDAQAGKIFDALDERRQLDNLRFILMIGDQIYADVHQYNGIGKVACTLEDYRDVYAYTWSRPPLQRLLSNLPAFMTLDDHEVDDDWHWVDLTRQLAAIPWWDRLLRWLEKCPPEERQIPLQRVQNALQAYWEHQGMHAPPLEHAPDLDAKGQYELPTGAPGSLAYTFTFGATAFFVMDTRTMRVRHRREHTMLGDAQWQALQDWLLAVKDAYPVKFLVTSSAFLFRMWLDIPKDRWSGYPEERDRLLHFIAANGITGVYFLAGDLHSAHAIRAELYGPQGRSIPVWEFCSSPFDQEPNRWARRTHLKKPFGPIKSLEHRFIIEDLNFGVVRVDCGAGDSTRVCFEIYGENGELIDQAGEE